jgi:hypothetical protein
MKREITADQLATQHPADFSRNRWPGSVALSGDL